ncbi:hypothetical protein LTR28_001809, partial [Elasticomyces elasticus]
MRPMFGAMTRENSITWVSKAAVENGRLKGYGLRKRIEPVKNCRNVGKKDMKLNDVMPKMKVDPERYTRDRNVASLGAGCSPLSEHQDHTGHMVYDWDDKEATCHKMYVEERQSLDDVMAFFKRELGFVPSKRAFQTQFRRWDFPSKQNPAHKNAPLVARIRELWESNT